MDVVESNGKTGSSVVELKASSEPEGPRDGEDEVTYLRRRIAELTEAMGYNIQVAEARNMMLRQAVEHLLPIAKVDVRKELRGVQQRALIFARQAMEATTNNPVEQTIKFLQYQVAAGAYVLVAALKVLDPNPLIVDNAEAMKLFETYIIQTQPMGEGKAAYRLVRVKSDPLEPVEGNA